MLLLLLLQILPLLLLLLPLLLLARMTNHPGLPETVPVLALKALYPRKPLSSGQTEMAGHLRAYY